MPSLHGKTIGGRLVITDRRPTKYRAQRTAIGGTTYASRREAEYCQGLIYLQRAGEITNLEFQVSYPLIVNGQKICTYIADARYVELDTGETVVIDVKGYRTKEYNLKRKLMKAVHDITIKEV
jgi:hypothetical protein